MSNTYTTSVPMYQRKIDIEGNYLPCSGYTIVSHALHPLPKPLTDLVTYLSSSELQKYYSFLPATSYHVTINPLEKVRDEHLSLLEHEQRKLHEQDTTTICTVEKLIRTKTLLIAVQFENNDKNQTFQNNLTNVRSNKLQQANILPNYRNLWHLTLAYQYKDIEDNETNVRLDEIIKNVPQSSNFRFDIPLDHMRICYYNDMTKFTPI